MKKIGLNASSDILPLFQRGWAKRTRIHGNVDGLRHIKSRLDELKRGT